MAQSTGQTAASTSALTGHHASDIIVSDNEIRALNMSLIKVCKCLTKKSAWLHLTSPSVL